MEKMTASQMGGQCEEWFGGIGKGVENESKKHEGLEIAVKQTQ